MEKIKEKIKTLNEELSVARKEMLIIDEKICMIEDEIKKYNDFVYKRQNELLNKLLHASIFKKFSYNFIHFQIHSTWMTFRFKDDWFCIYESTWVSCMGASGKYPINTINKNTVLGIPEVQEFIEYVLANYKTVYNKIDDLNKKIVHGHLYDNHELAVQFLLCTKKYFLKEIRYIIANKILFFCFLKIEKN